MFLPSPDELPLRYCINPSCPASFQPASASQKWCVTCRINGTRNRTLACRATHATTGRICKWCKIPDRLVPFPLTTVCSGCKTKAAKNGTCFRCKEPLQNQLWTVAVPYCPRCFPAPIPKHYVRVVLIHRGKRRVTFKSPNCKVKLSDRQTTLQYLVGGGGSAVMRVDELSYYRLSTRRPRQIKDHTLWDHPWEEHFLEISHVFRNELYDLNHFVSLGEADPLEFTWFRYTLCGRRGRIPSRIAAKRRWERFKAKLRRFEIPFAQPQDNQVVMDPGSLSSIAELVLNGSS